MKVPTHAQLPVLLRAARLGGRHTPRLHAATAAAGGDTPLRRCVEHGWILQRDDGEVQLTDEGWRVLRTSRPGDTFRTLLPHPDPQPRTRPETSRSGT